MIHGGGALIFFYGKYLKMFVLGTRHFFCYTSFLEKISLLGYNLCRVRQKNVSLNNMVTDETSLICPILKIKSLHFG